MSVTDKRADRRVIVDTKTNYLTQEKKKKIIIIKSKAWDTWANNATLETIYALKELKINIKPELLQAFLKVSTRLETVWLTEVDETPSQWTITW